ncbi:hydroxyacid dehydrogenase [Bacillus sp. EB600]|uniref:hydroxyacid dehydrogenase n=1 Tax=Bacillus sp. EB600 TaxID=2806345 RepID=UPI00210CD6F0|nr:hydroxyacid dehydrogenase [Bacillus sp. EB600]MCQ6282093.1 hydroxyacid dehydrogenase [Bacillus sp. EB600]
MKKPHILQIYPMNHPDGEKVLNELAQVKKLVAYDESEIVNYLQNHQVDGIILRAPARITKTILDNCQGVKAISGAGVGLDNIEVEYATKKGIPILHAPKINSQATAEHAVGLLLAVLKKLTFFDRETRKGNSAIRNGNYTFELHGKTVGIVGFGTIAQITAKILAHGFGMKAVAYVRSITDDKKKIADQYGIELTTSLEEIFIESDAVSLHLPLTQETDKMIDYSLFKLMKKTAVLINTARGGIVNEEDLARALREQLFLGAGIDVFAKEPPPKDHPFFQLENVVTSPHVAGLSYEAASKSSMTIAENIIKVIKGEQISGIANKQVFIKELKCNFLTV